MKLEQEIQQKKFKNEFEKLGVNIIFSHSWLSNIHGKTLRKYGVTSTQYNILRILRGQYPNPASVNLLKERMLDKRSDASRLVERMRMKGLLEREISKIDRRRAEVVISKKGLNLLKKIDKINPRLEDSLKNLKVGEAKKVNELLDKMRG